MLLQIEKKQSLQIKISRMKISTKIIKHSFIERNLIYRDRLQTEMEQYSFQTKFNPFEIRFSTA